MKIFILYVLTLFLFVSSSIVYSSPKTKIVSQKKTRKYFDENNDENAEAQLTDIPALDDSISNEVNFELGIGSNLILMFVNKYDSQNKAVENSIKPSFLDIFFSVGFRFHQYYNINFRFGFDEIYEDFGGFNGGIFFESGLFASNIFGILGIDFYNNIGNSHNTSESGGNFIFYCLGAGYRVSNNFTLNLMYWLPNKKVFGTNTVYKDDSIISYESYDKINHGLVRIGFQYSFIF